jgi:hypothetical protein
MLDRLGKNVECYTEKYCRTMLEFWDFWDVLLGNVVEQCRLGKNVRCFTDKCFILDFLLLNFTIFSFENTTWMVY